MDWDNLINNYGDSLLLYTRQWCHSLSEAEDVVQQAYLRLWKKVNDRKSKIKEPVPYLFSIARTIAIDLARSAARRKKREEHADEVFGKGACLFESSVEEKEQVGEMEEMLKELPDEQREVIVMKIWAEMTFDEISKSLGISIGTASSRYRYGLEKMKSLIAASEVPHE